MTHKDNHASVSGLEIGSFLVILLVGAAFGYFVYDKSGFVDEEVSLSLLSQQQNIAGIINNLESVNQTIAIESGYESIGSRQRVGAAILNAQAFIKQLKETSETLDKANTALFDDAEPVLEDIKTWLTDGTDQHPPDSELVYELSSQRLRASLETFLDAQVTINSDHRSTISAYHQQLERFRGSVLTLLLGAISLIILVISLNMKQRQTQSKLASERKLISDAVNNLDEGVVLTDEQDACLVINKTLEILCPQLNEQLAVGHPFEESFNRSIHLGDLKLIDVQTHELITPSSDGSHREVDVEAAREYVTAAGVYLRITRRYTENSGNIITFSDITYLKLAQKQLHRQATKDGLTGLANRNHFISKLDDAIARSKRAGHKVALMVFDLDKFKQVNDTLGHAVGDELLRSVANRIRENLREIDVSARMGGDEFAAFLDQIKDTREVRITADRIIRELHQRLDIDGIDVEVSSSIGIAMFPDDADDLSALLKHADSACYQAKQLGRNNYQIYNRDMKVRAMQQMTMESRLRGALKESALLLHFQPQMELSNHTISGVEAFLRWHDPKLGSVRPDHFIPLAEKTGMIAEIGEWVIRQACQQIRAWIDEHGMHIQVAINISPKQFRLQNLPNIIDKALADFDISPSMLALEITESVIMNDLHAAVETLKELGNRGLTLVIDDFGAGSSSLYRLKELPIHALKIDQSFIKDLSTTRDAQEITGAIIAIAQKLHLKTIAEGVETREQLGVLKHLGCNAIQGYLLQKPSTATELQMLLAKSQAKLKMAANHG